MVFLEEGKNKNKGFSLIELTISLTVISIILLAFSSITIYNLKVTKRLNHIKIAKELAHQKLSFLKSLPFDSKELRLGTHKPETYYKNFVLSYTIKEKNNLKSLKWIELVVYILPEKDSLKFHYLLSDIKCE